MQSQARPIRTLVSLLAHDGDAVLALWRAWSRCLSPLLAALAMAAGHGSGCSFPCVMRWDRDEWQACRE